MSILKVTITVVPGATWQQKPADRPLQFLVDDARAMQRRAKKGVNVAVQRGLFLQIARRVDNLALLYGRTDSSVQAMSFEGKDAEELLRLHGEVLAMRTSLPEPEKPRGLWLFRWLKRAPQRRPVVSAWPDEESPPVEYFLPGGEVGALSDRYAAVAMTRKTDPIAQAIGQLLSRGTPEGAHAVLFTVSLRNPMVTGGGT